MSNELQERYLDGSTRLQRGVRLKNPTDRTVRFTGENAILRESQVLLGKRPDGTPRYGNRTFEVVIEPGQTAVVPEEVANVLVDLKCVQCGRPWRFAQPGQARKPATVCIDSSHPRSLRGGLAPQLVLVGDDDRVVPIEVAGNLEPEPPPQYDAGDLHKRVMARIAGGAK